MANASFAIPHFLGGEISQFAQGRFDKPDYRNSLRSCLNAFPAEIGPWIRRPGTRNAGTTRNGAPGRVMRFDFEQSSAITNEFTDGHLRFRSGASMIWSPGSEIPLDLATPYAAGSWASIRAVQAETTQILLAPTVAPQALTVTTLPAPGVSPQFALATATFNDGPYLDPFTNGVQATPSAKSGIVSLTLAFPTWDATKAYSAGAFVTYVGVNYKSLVDQNVNNNPSLITSAWASTSAAAAINGGQGFLGTDTGRLVRLYSEPAAWAVGTAYSAGAVVSYNATGLPGGELFYQALTSTTGNIPGTDLTHWTIVTTGAAIWTWGKITGLSNIIDRALAGSVNFGDMTAGGGNAAAFDGVFVQPSSSAAEKTGAATTLTSFVGKDYSGASDQKIHSATIYPSSDIGFALNSASPHSAGGVLTVTLNLRGKASLPISSSDGTLLGTSGVLSNTNSAVTILSSDQVTAWKYVWIELIATVSGDIQVTATSIAEVSFFAPSGTGTSTGVNVEILGPPLLYTTPIITWRLGVYSNTTGWPTCGLYFDGRLYLGGAVSNRWDACYANGIVDSTINFAPTDQFGAVSPAHAISYTFNSDGVNPILWMMADLQGVLMGTKAGEWLVQAPTAGSIAPNNVTARNVTNHGSANIQPCRTEHTKVFVKRHARKLLEYFPDVFSGKFSAPNLADKAEHLTAAGVAEIAYTSAVTPIIWGRDTAGALFGITYKRDSLASSQPPTFYGWHHHELGSGRKIESICSGASIGGDLDALTMVTNDPATGIRHVEIMTDAGDENSALADSWFLDDAVTPAVTIAVNGVTFSGLSHLEGKTIQIFAGGLDLGDPGEGKPPADFTVTGGSVFVPFADGVTSGPGAGLFTPQFTATKPPYVAGFTYNSDGQIVRPVAPADSGTRAGPALGHIIRQHKYAFKLVNTRGLQIGRDFNHLKPANLRTNPSDPATALKQLSVFTGIAYDSYSDNYGRDNSICWRIARPFPSTIAALNCFLEGVDE